MALVDNKAKIQALLAGINALPEQESGVDLLSAYPVGSIYLSANETSPASLFGGTWEQMKDRFLLGAGDSYASGATGGAKSVSYTPKGSNAGTALTNNQLPKLTGKINAGSGSTGASAGGYGAFRSASGVFSTATEMQYGRPSENNAIAWPSNAASYQTVNLDIGGGATHTHTFTGTAASIATMPPYLAVYMWKRVS